MSLPGVPILLCRCVLFVRNILNYTLVTYRLRRPGSWRYVAAFWMADLPGGRRFHGEEDQHNLSLSDISILKHSAGRAAAYCTTHPLPVTLPSGPVVPATFPPCNTFFLSITTYPSTSLAFTNQMGGSSSLWTALCLPLRASVFFVNRGRRKRKCHTLHLCLLCHSN